MHNHPTFLNDTAHCTRPGINPAVFDSTTPTNIAKAKATCTGCPLRKVCLEHAMTVRATTGTWGGLTKGERTQLRKDRKQSDCGTEGALLKHRTLGETCTECETAHEAWREGQRRRALERAHLVGGTPAGAATHRRLGEPVCRMCLRAEAQRNQARRDANPRRSRAKYSTAA